MIADVLAALASTVLALWGHVSRPSYVECPEGWEPYGVRPTGRTFCRPEPPDYPTCRGASYCDPPDVPLPRIYVRVWCSSTPVVDGSGVGCL